MKSVIFVLLAVLLLGQQAFAAAVPTGMSIVENKQKSVNVPDNCLKIKCPMGPGAGCTENEETNAALNPYVQLARKNLALENVASKLGEGMFSGNKTVNLNISKIMTNCVIKINDISFSMFKLPSIGDIMNALKQALQAALQQACNFLASKVESAVNGVINEALGKVAEKVAEINSYIGMTGLNISIPGVENLGGFKITLSGEPYIAKAYDMLRPMDDFTNILIKNTSK